MGACEACPPANLDREPSRDEIADRLGLSAMQRVLVRRALQARRLRLDVDRGDPEDGMASYESKLSDPNSRSQCEVEREETRGEVARRLDDLEPCEREVLSLRFGLSGDVPMTLGEIGGRLEFSREWIRKIERRAIAKLRAERSGRVRSAREHWIGSRHS